MPTSRRNFLKLCAVVGAAGVTTAIASQLALNRPSITKGKSEEEDKTPPQWVMLIDVDKCTACNDKEISDCLDSCATMHYIPKNFKAADFLAGISGGWRYDDKPQPWIDMFEKEDNPLMGSYILPRPCMHCESPPCLHVCPTGATFKTDEGTVLIDHQVCIGCRMCMGACPYNARSFNWGEPEPWKGTREEEKAFFSGRGKYSPEFAGPHQKGTVEKCDFCAHSAREGGLPACVGSCPDGSIYFGDLNQNLVTNGKQETITLSATIRERMGYRLHEDLGTKPRVYYLPKKD
ncbi:MAG: 4Fe-4S dicluster domain-containing protein [Candidatus Hodarchaeales archaeon]